MAQLSIRELLLIADHHPEDFAQFRAALAANEIKTPVQHLTNGRQLKDYLLGKGEYADGTRFPMPQVVLTEWDLPEANALDLLRWIREENRPAMLPMMVWTRVAVSDRELKEAYHLGLNAFFSKPNKAEELKSVVRLIADYWKLAEKPVLTRK